MKNMKNPIIKAGYDVNESWQKGNARIHDVRQAGFKIHQLAKSSQDIVVQTALRVVGQAVVTGHMREHAMVSSDYAVKVINLLFPNDINAVRQERFWQIEHWIDWESISFSISIFSSLIKKSWQIKNCRFPK